MRRHGSSESPAFDRQGERYSPPPALVELVRLLPEAGSKFDLQARADWLNAFAATFNLIYGHAGLLRCSVQIAEVTAPETDQ